MEEQIYCPYCESEVEQGVVSIDDDMSFVPIIYLSEEDSQKRGIFNRFSTEPVVALVHRTDRMKGYYCRRCRKIIVEFNETFSESD